MNLLYAISALIFIQNTHSKPQKKQIKKAIESAKNKPSNFQSFKEFRIKSIEGQLSEEVKKKLKTKYWKNAEKIDPEAEIQYELFEFLDLIVIKGILTINGTSQKFIIKHSFSKTVPWRHDEKLIEKIAKEIYYKAQFIAHPKTKQ